MKIVVTGAAGLLGKGLVQVFGERHDVSPLTRQEGDITDAQRMRSLIQEIAPDVVVHAAGNPDIDACEKNPELAWKVNSEATKELASITSQTGGAFAFVSTDAVFDGKSSRPYVESDVVNPPSVYGKTKVAAEGFVRTHAKHFVFRVSVLFGPGKANFVNKAWCKAMGNEPYVVANDQLASATYTVDAAATMLQVIEADAFGTYHVCNHGECTRYELARRAVELAGLNAGVVVGKPVQEMARVGPRVKYSVMKMEALQRRGFQQPRGWEEALRAYVGTLKPAS